MSRQVAPTVPAFEDLDWRRFRLDLDRRSDTLYWDFFEHAPPAVSYPVTDHLLYNVDPATEEVVGLQFDGFLAHVIHEVPAFLALADLIGLTESEVAEIRGRSDPEQRRRGSLRTILAAMMPHEHGVAVV